MENMEKIREQFPITKNKVFLNHAGQSPLPKQVADVIRKFVDDFSNFGTTSIEWNDGGKPLFAKLICAKPEEIAFVENTSVGLNIAANMLSYPPGSNIVTTDLEYPSVVYPWLRKSLGVKVHYVKNVDGKILLEDVEKAVDDSTVAVAVSHVEYVNGFRHNLRALSEIAHEHGAYLIVDAIQSAGAMQIDAKRDDVDFLASACYKWLLSPPGAGYFYVKDELVEKFEPPFVGWASVKDEVFETIDFWDIWSLKLSETASRFEVGSPSFISLVGATEALKMLLNFGVENIEKRILKLTDHLIDAVKGLGLKLQTPEELQCRSGIVNFRINKPQEVAEKLKNKGIVVSARSHGIRVSPHFYNTEGEIDKLVDEIKQCGKLVYKIKKIDENNKQGVIDFLGLDVVRHVFAFYDIQHEPDYTTMYAAFENGSLRGYVLTYTALDFPSVILECDSNTAEKLIDYAPENRFIMHVSPNLLPIINRKFPHAKCYVEDWMLVKKDEPSFFKSKLLRRLHTEDDASKFAMLLSSRKNRTTATVKKYVELISKQPIYGVFVNDELISYAGSFIQLPQVWMIGGVYTHPKHRNKGYATLATSAVTEEALKNAEAAALFVRSDNHSAIRVYEKIGYKKIGEKLWIDAGTGMKP